MKIEKHLLSLHLKHLWFSNYCQWFCKWKLSKIRFYLEKKINKRNIDMIYSILKQLILLIYFWNWNLFFYEYNVLYKHQIYCTKDKFKEHKKHHFFVNLVLFTYSVTVGYRQTQTHGKSWNEIKVENRRIIKELYNFQCYYRVTIFSVYYYYFYSDNQHWSRCCWICTEKNLLLAQSWPK